jgi:hypothetical protein
VSTCLGNGDGASSMLLSYHKWARSEYVRAVFPRDADWWVMSLRCRR